MTLTLNLPHEVGRKLNEKAAAAGLDVTRYVYQLILKDVEKPRSFDEIRAPFARAVEASGMSDEKFDSLIEDAREEVWWKSGSMEVGKKHATDN